jgi:uncharacterized protein (TIGR02145 family)
MPFIKKLIKINIKVMKKIFLATLFLCFAFNFCSQKSGTFTDSRDGKVYTWLKIGKQVWMAENLSYLPSVYSPFDEQTHAYKNLKWDMPTLKTPYQFVPGYDGNNVDKAKATPYYKKYGVLYNYASALKSCPAGWHLSSDSEWKELERFIGMKREVAELMGQVRGDVAEKLKSTQFWNDEVKGTDEYGFCAIPSGVILQDKDYDGGAKFYGEGVLTSFWTSEEHETIVGKIAAIRRGLDNNKRGLLPSANKSIIRFPMNKSFGLSVRCIKD